MDNWVFKDSTHLLPTQTHPFDTPYVGQEVRGSYDYEMIFNILCNFHYFRSYDFISLILCVFMTFLIKLESCYGIYIYIYKESCYDTVSIRICLRIFLLGR